MPRRKKKPSAAATTATAEENAVAKNGTTQQLTTTTATMENAKKATASASSGGGAAVLLADAVASYPDLVRRRDEIETRLKRIEVGPPPKPQKRSSAAATTVVVPVYSEKTDTHHDFLLKEMQWLAADFAAERKRHLSARKKSSNGVRQYFASQETRRLRRLADAELKRRRLAALIGRKVRGWWNKLERVVSYKQKVSLEQQRRKAMNQQLVSLVKVTEKYTDALARQLEDDDDESDEDDNNEEEGGEGATTNGDRRRRRKHRRRMSIEEALSEGLGSRKSKTRVTDYARMNQQLSAAEQEEDGRQDQGSLYGETTASDQSSDSSFAPERNAKDDESTLKQAEAEETLERRRRRKMGAAGSGDDDVEDDDLSDTTFQGDPVELRKLQEESNMDVQDVIARLKREGAADDDDEQVTAANGEATSRASKRVKFAKGERVQFVPAPGDPGEDADDDGDASDVEDFVMMEEEAEEGASEDEEDGEFVTDTTEADDETTMEQEEAMPREMTYEQELQLLEEENELPVEELRKRYAAVFGGGGGDGDATNIHEDEDQKPKALDSSRKSSQSREHSEATEPTSTTASGAISAKMAATSETASLLLSGANQTEEGDDGGAEEFEPDANDLVDDETTIEAEERLGREMSAKDEIALLKRESEMSVGELRALYLSREEKGDSEDDDTMEVEEEEGEEAALSYLAGNSTADDEDQENDGEYQPIGDEKDDETTIEAEERLGRELSPKEEITMLKRESEEPIEALRERYGATVGVATLTNDSRSPPSRRPVKRKRRDVSEGSGDDETAEDGGDGDGKAENGTSKGKRNNIDSEGDMSDAGRIALVALEKSAERARRARATRPFILSPWVKLREYQQIGLNWLVSHACIHAIV